MKLKFLPSVCALLLIIGCDRQNQTSTPFKPVDSVESPISVPVAPVPEPPSPPASTDSGPETLQGGAIPQPQTPASRERVRVQAMEEMRNMRQQGNDPKPAQP